MKENVLLSNSKTLLCLYHLFESEHCQREMNSQRERNSRRSIVDQNTTERGTNMELSQYAQRPSHNMNPLDLVEINREKKVNFLFNILTVLSQDRSQSRHNFKSKFGNQSKAVLSGDTTAVTQSRTDCSKRLLLRSELTLSKKRNRTPKISHLFSSTCRGVDFVPYCPVHSCCIQSCFIKGNEVMAPYFILCRLSPQKHQTALMSASLIWLTPPDDIRRHSKLGSRFARFACR